MVSVTSSQIDPARIFVEVSTPQSGGIGIFVGTVRNHSGGKRVSQLEYSAYVPMAEKLMAGIEEEMRHTWVLHRVALVHRTGLLNVGDVAVVTAVSSAHRNEAFDACRYAIDKIKSVVPIWKKEFYEDGLAWVVGQHDVDEIGG
jgi:molybdopterin synthase catalytic subunit